ncbi:uncharacterized protein BT62DRAFT_925898 [Guyanagaster necrorhizus]|uniref:DUF6534 domain-containing protein n=1 Tax=Guyanagaster necrorhizus TaxID=856835 RepID=A0A9P8AXZ0_9AGAR|nr:uncharacterized protein BT62DRAFT_925898 [Guyanagaster necrorhizus MCA 3950]KAG7451716.1 hypothetical protein BT62DRAFT_925898 [Guyanagaster necrorhizus MCA 3950]
MVNTSSTLGSLLLGGLFSATFTGMMSVQSLLYFKLFPTDKPRIKALVTILWLFDVAHSGTVWAGLWNYLIVHFNDTARIDQIPQAIPITIILTAVSTICVHLFFAERIFRLSKNNRILAGSIVILAFLRLTCACVTAGAMLSIQTYSGFRNNFNWVFSAGLGLSSAVDILVTGSLLKLLHKSRKASLSASFDHIIDSLILYTLECGAVTCIATIASMICWLVMNNNLVFLGLHFVISKLYSNSLLATLITRYELRNSRERSTSDGIVDFDVFNMRSPRRLNIFTPGTSFTQPMQVSVKQSVTEYGAEGSIDAEQ